jgi:alpha-tubulin suppressor-like RCC1 family protein
MQQIGAASNYVQVAAPKNNFQFRWALDATGAIYKFGGGAQPTWAINGSYKSITLGGGDIFCGIRTDGTLACASDNVYGQAGVGTIAPVNTDTQVGVYSDWVKVSSGGTMTCGLRAGGTVYCWGDNSRGTAGDGTAVSTVPVLSH